MTTMEAIKIIQIVERARQGRLRAKLNEESRNMNRMFKTKEPDAADIESAAVCIQKVLWSSVQGNVTLCVLPLLIIWLKL